MMARLVMRFEEKPPATRSPALHSLAASWAGPAEGEDALFAGADAVDVAAVAMDDDDSGADSGNQDRPTGGQNHPASNGKKAGGDDGAEREVAGPGDDQDKKQNHSEEWNRGQIEICADEGGDG